MENIKYCYSCGDKIQVDAEICPHCGVHQEQTNSNSYDLTDINQDWITLVILCVVLGVFGVHRFYLRRTGSAILMLLTFGGFGIWWLADVIIAATGNFKDNNGDVIPLKTKDMICD